MLGEDDESAAFLEFRSSSNSPRVSRAKIGTHDLNKVGAKKEECSSKKKNEDVEREELPPVGVFSLFRYSSSFDRFLMIVAVVFAVVSGVCMPAGTIIFGHILNKLIDFDQTRNNVTNTTMSTEEFLQETAHFCLLTVLCKCFDLTCNYVFVSFFSLAAANQAFRIRCLFMKSVIKQDIEWFDTHQTGDFASRITGDLNHIQDGIGEKIGICIGCLSTTLLSVSAGIYHGWKLALVVLSITPVLTITTAILSKLQATVAVEEQEAYGMAGAVAEEVLSAIRTVVAFGGERKEIARYDSFLTPARQKGIKRGFMTSIGAGVNWFTIFSGYALAFWYGIKLIVESEEKGTKEYDGGVLLIVFFNMMSASMFIGQTAPHFEAFAMARGAAAKIYSIIDRQPSIDSSSSDGHQPPSLEGSIRLKNINFNYPSRPTVQVLRGFCLDVEPGQTVALVGPSGCGKSTVIQLVLRFYDTNSGDVELDGNSVKDLNVGWLRDHIGLVGQEPVLFSSSIEENIKMGKRNATPEEVVSAAKLANVHEFIDSLPQKYGTLVGDHGTQLSGGQKQRIAIARALVKNPRVLLLDEATSALDTESEAVVQKALDQASSGRTTIVVAHRLSTIRNADKIVVLSEGILKEMGTHDELMQMRGVYYDLVQAQAKAEGDEELKEVHVTPQTLEHLISATSEEPSLDSVRKVRSGFSERQISTVSSASGRIETSLRDEELDVKEAPSLFRLLKLSAPEWPYTVVGALSSLLMGIHYPAYGIIFGGILGVLSGTIDIITQQTTFFCLMFVLLAITSFVFMFLKTFMFSVAGERLTSRLRKMVFANIITQDMTFFDHPKNSVGSLCSRLTSDASSVQAATGSRMSIVLQAFSTMIVAIIIGLYYNYKIGLMALAFIPLIILAGYLEGFIIRSQDEEEKSATETASKVAVEAIEGIRTVAALHQEDAFYHQFHDVLLEPHKKSRIRSHVRGLTYGVGTAMHAFAYVSTLYFGSRMVGAKQMTYSDLLKVIEGVIVGTMSVGQTIAFNPEYQKAKIAAVRIFRLLDLKPQIDAFSKQGLSRPSIRGDIRFRNVRFNYPSRPDVGVLRGLDLDIEPGQTVALVGSSGCGKSTCVQLLERFYDAQQGKVLIDEEDVKDLNVANHRSHLGLVSQEPVLFSYSIAENIAYGSTARNVDMGQVIEAARKANIHTFVASLPQGYDTPVGDKGAQLSVGQKQRVAIARALLRDPKILLLDEATSALDAESEKVVQEALDKARSGRTCLIIAHRLTTIQNADVIVVLHRGKIVERGTHQELLNLKGIYYKLHNTQASAV